MQRRSSLYKSLSVVAVCSVFAPPGTRDWTRGCGGPPPPDPRAQCQAALRDILHEGFYTYSWPNPDITQILNGCPQIASHIVWEDGAGNQTAWAQWTPAQQARLQVLYSQLIGAVYPYDVACPDPISAQAPGGDGTTSVSALFFNSVQAFDMYAASVANGIYVESSQMVPWSLLDETTDDLDALFSSTVLFSRIKPSQGNIYPYGITAGQDFQATGPGQGNSHLWCDPRDSYNFLSGAHSTSGASLIGPTQTATLANISQWMSFNVAHGGIPMDLERARFAYTLQDRLRAAPPDRNTPEIIAPIGCHSAGSLFFDLARGINLPLRVVTAEDAPVTSGGYLDRTHAGLLYGYGTPGERVLWHLDDLYAMVDLPVFPLQADGTAMPSLFDPQVSQQFFDHVWQDPGTLTSWGFALQPTFPVVYPGIGFGVNDRGISEDRYEYGLFSGYWNYASNDVGSETFSNLESTWHYEREYDLCGWDLMSTFCADNGDASQFQVYVNNATHQSLGDPLLPVQHNSLDFYIRINQCVQAYGGCSNVLALQADWASKLGTVVWKD